MNQSPFQGDQYSRVSVSPDLFTSEGNLRMTDDAAEEEKCSSNSSSKSFNYAFSTLRPCQLGS